MCIIGFQYSMRWIDCLNNTNQECLAVARKLPVGQIENNDILALRKWVISSMGRDWHIEQNETEMLELIKREKWSVLGFLPAKQYGKYSDIIGTNVKTTSFDIQKDGQKMIGVYQRRVGKSKGYLGCINGEQSVMQIDKLSQIKYKYYYYYHHCTLRQYTNMEWWLSFNQELTTLLYNCICIDMHWETLVGNLIRQIIHFFEPKCCNVHMYSKT